jgi:hypothetical protein
MVTIGGAGQTKSAAALTHRTIEAMKPEGLPYRVPDSRCPGLAVRVATSGTKTFDLVFRISGGSVRRLSLGAFPEISLETARDRTNELTRAARSGRDVIAEGKASGAKRASCLSVASLIEDYSVRELRGRKRTAKEMESRLRRGLAPKLDCPAEDLRRRDLRELLDAVADAGLEREAEKRRQTIGTDGQFPETC